MVSIVLDDWKSFAAIGLTVIGSIFAFKMDSDQVCKVSIHAIESCREIVPAFRKG